VLRPSPPLVAIGGRQNTSVINDAAHAERRPVPTRRSCTRTRRRASFISSAVKRPCCFSQSAIAARPARRPRASRAAPVIQRPKRSLRPGRLPPGYFGERPDQP
jgi:hypothetical protein